MHLPSLVQPYCTATLAALQLQQGWDCQAGTLRRAASRACLAAAMCAQHLHSCIRQQASKPCPCASAEAALCTQGDDDFLVPDEANEIPQNTDAYRPREPLHMPQRDQDITAEQLNEYVQNRFGDRGGGRDDGGDDFEQGDGGVQQQALLPTNADPKLWLVRPAALTAWVDAAAGKQSASPDCFLCQLQPATLKVGV